MAPQTPPDPLGADRIDISLDLVGQGSLEAVNLLNKQLSVLTTFMANAQAGSPEAQAAAAAAIGTSMHNTSVADTGGRWASRPPAPLTPQQLKDQAVLQNAYRSSPIGRMVTDFREGGQENEGAAARLGRAVDKELSYYGATERTQARRRGPSPRGAADPYERIYSGTTGGFDAQQTTGGGPSSSASMPGDPLSNDPVWRQAARSNMETWERAQEGFRLPPGGLSLNFQDKLRIASDFFTRSAERRYESARIQRGVPQIEAAQQEALSMGWQPGDFAQMGIETPDLSDVAVNRGRVAGLLRIGEENAGYAALARDVGRHVQGRIQQAYAFGGELQQTGVQAGFERAGQVTIPGTNIGFTNPLDFFRAGSAAREGLNQRINTMRLRLMGGIDRGQAQAIVGGLAGAGWTGEQGQNAAFDAIAPLVQQGQNPELAVGTFDYAMRQGNASMKDFVETMSNLGDSARAANMSLDEYQQGLTEFAQQARSLGAVGTQGLNLGRNITGALGIAPQVASTLLTNPMVQAFSMRQGLLPNELGMAGSNQITGSLYGGMEMAMKAASGFSTQPIRDPATGRMISGQERQMNQAASIMGIDRELFQRLWRQRGTAQHGARALDELQTYQGEMDTLQHRVDQNKKVPMLHNQQISPGDWVPTHAGAPGAVDMGNGVFARKATRVEFGDKYPSDPRRGPIPNNMVEEAKRQLQTGDSGSWNKIHGELRAMLPAKGDESRGHFDKLLHQIEGESGSKRVGDIRSFITERDKVQVPDDGPTVYVKFKGAAAKYFEQDDVRKKTKNITNAGGPSTAEAMLQPRAADAYAAAQSAIDAATTTGRG